MMGRKERTFAPVERVSVEDLGPADHVYRHLERTLDLSFVRALVAPCYAAGGRPSIDPIVFLKLQLVMFFEGIRSERHLLRVVADRLSVRWYLGYDFGEALPDHSSLTKIRTRYGLETFRRFFEAIVEQCAQAGLIWGAELYIDATKVVANASLDSLTPRFAVAARAHVDDLFALDAGAAGPPPLGQGAASAPSDAEAASMQPPVSQPPVSQPPVSQPPVSQPPVSQPPVSLSPNTVDPDDRADVVRANAARHDWFTAAGQRERTRLAARFHRTADDLVSTTDPDATYLHQREGMRLGYQDHDVVDGGTARIILAALVAPAEVAEDHVALDLLWRARFRWRLRPHLASADKAYASLGTLQGLEDQGLRAYVPLPHWNARARYFPKEAFVYDAARDVYTCPGGASVARTRLMKPPRLTLYRAEAATCAACPLRPRCTPGRQGRSIARRDDEGYIERVRSYAGTPAFEKARRKRQVWVEPLFGEAKMWHGLRRFRLRRLWRVNCEALLTATGKNLKRLLNRHGWGRRPFPSGAPGVLLRGTVRARCPS